MKHKKTGMLCILMLLICALSTTAFAIDESEVESAIAAASKEEVAGNVFIWFLCAVAFLKVSQKIDSFMSAIGINVGQTGGSMLGELMVAGKALGAAMKATGSAVGGIFNRSHNSSSSYTQAAGQAFPGSGGGLIGVAKRAAGNAAANSATGRAAGVSAFVGGAMFGSSMKSGGRLAGDVVSAVATGNIASVGSITGAKAAQALTSYLGYQSMNGDESEHGVTPIPQSASAVGEDVITLDGGTAAGAIPGAAGHSVVDGSVAEVPGGVVGSPRHLVQMPLVLPSPYLPKLRLSARLRSVAVESLVTRHLRVEERNAGLLCTMPNSTWSPQPRLKRSRPQMARTGTNSMHSPLSRRRLARRRAEKSSTMRRSYSRCRRSRRERIRCDDGRT